MSAQQRRPQVGEKDQDAAQPGAQLRLKLSVHNTVDAFAKSLSAPRFFHQLDKSADEYDHHQHTCIIGVCKLHEKVIPNHGMYCCKWVSAAENYCTHKSTAKQ